jgi:hypothetical protein
LPELGLFSLFSNFVNLLCGIASNPRVAQLVTRRFAKLLDRVFACELDVGGDSALARSVRLFSFLYALASAALLRGDVLCPFESKFGSLIALNLTAPAVPGFLSQEILHFDDSTVNAFLEDAKCPIMETIYKEWKPGNHRRLTLEMQAFDRLVLVAFAHHCHLLPQLLDVTFKVDPPFRPTDFCVSPAKLVTSGHSPSG